MPRWLERSGLVCLICAQAACGSSVFGDPIRGDDDGSAGSGGAAGEGGSSATGGADGSADTGPDAKVDAGTDAHGTDAGQEADADAGQVVTTPSCVGLPDTCGPKEDEDCCTNLMVPGGTFYRSYDGSDDTVDSYPATVSPFSLDRFEVTVGRFRAFVDAGMGIQPTAPSAGDGAHPLILGTGWDSAWDVNLPPITADFKTDLKCDSKYQTWTDDPGANESLPTNCVSWYEAFAFCMWDGGRLPTEAEWNFAASGGSEQRYYPWSVPQGSTAIDESYASYDCIGDGVAGCTFADILVPGSKSPKGDGKWGHADLGGNLWEMVFDWYSLYPEPCTDCAKTTEGSTSRVMRGGDFLYTAPFVRAADRQYIPPMLGNYGIGFRCARDM